MSTVKNYLSLIKFSHTIFAMPFAMIGFFLAISEIPISNQWNLNSTVGWEPLNKLFITPTELVKKFLLVVLCMITARSAAMAYNRYLDKQFDAKNPRTAIREIPSGIITAKNALAFVILNCIAFITPFE